MSDETIKDFTVLTDAQVNDDTKLIPFGTASTGKMGTGTTAQAKLIFSCQRAKYTATGTEGTTLTIAAIAGRTIIAIFREGALIYDVDSDPDSTEYIWDSTNITLGLAANPSERFLILYKYS